MYGMLRHHEFASFTFITGVNLLTALLEFAAEIYRSSLGSPSVGCQGNATTLSAQHCSLLGNLNYWSTLHWKFNTIDVFWQGGCFKFASGMAQGGRTTKFSWGSMFYVAFCRGSSTTLLWPTWGEGERQSQTDGRGLIEDDMCPVSVCPQITRPYAGVALFSPVSISNPLFTPWKWGGICWWDARCQQLISCFAKCALGPCRLCLVSCWCYVWAHIVLHPVCTDYQLCVRCLCAHFVGLNIGFPLHLLLFSWLHKSVTQHL